MSDAESPELQSQQIVSDAQLGLHDTVLNDLISRFGNPSQYALPFNPASPMNDFTKQGLSGIQDIYNDSQGLNAGRQTAINRQVAGTPTFVDDEQSRADRQKYFQEAFVNPSKAAYREDIAGVGERLASSGTSRGGDAQKAYLDAANTYELGLSGQLAELVRGDTQDARASAELAAERVLPAAESSRLNQQYPINSILNAGEIQNTYDQNTLSGELSQWLSQDPYNSSAAGFLNFAMQPTETQYLTQGSPSDASAYGSLIGNILLPGVGGSLGGAVGAGAFG